MKGPVPTQAAQIRIVQQPGGGRIFQCSPTQPSMPKSSVDRVVVERRSDIDFASYSKAALKTARKRFGAFHGARYTHRKYGLLTTAYQFAGQVSDPAERQRMIAGHQVVFSQNFSEIIEAVSHINDPETAVKILQAELDALDCIDYYDVSLEQFTLQFELISKLMKAELYQETAAMIAVIKDTATRLPDEVKRKRDVSKNIIYIQKIESFIEFISLFDVAKEACATGDFTAADQSYQMTMARLASLKREGNPLIEVDGFLERFQYFYSAFLDQAYGYYDKFRMLKSDLNPRDPDIRQKLKTYKRDRQRWMDSLTDDKVRKDIGNMQTQASLIKEVFGRRDKIYSDLVMRSLMPALYRVKDMALAKAILTEMAKEFEETPPKNENEKKVLGKTYLHLAALAESYKERQEYQRKHNALGTPIKFEMNTPISSLHTKESAQPQVDYQTSMDFHSFIQIYVQSIPELTSALETLFQTKQDVPLDQYKYVLIDGQYHGVQLKTICNADPNTIVVLGPNFSNHGDLLNAGPTIVLGRHGFKNIITDNVVIGDARVHGLQDSPISSHDGANFIQEGRIITRDDVDNSIVIKVS